MATKQVSTTTAVQEINKTWEYVQACVALAVVFANIAAEFMLPEQNQLLGNAMFTVLGFYFGRTNHTKSSSGDPLGR